MIILQDTRERSPLKFNHKYITQVKVQKLDYGDYTAQFKDGYIPPFYFERKSLGDLFGTLSKGYVRFKKEIKRSQEAKVMLIILIEASLSKVKKGYKHSGRSGISILQQLFTLMIRHHVPFVCSGSREESAEFVTQFYIAVGKDRLRKLGKRRL